MLTQENIDKIKSFIDNSTFNVAKSYLHHFEELIHNDKNIYILLGEVYNKTDNLHEAERYYKKALKLDPINIHCYAVLEQILRIQGRYKECEEILNKVKIIKPDMQGVVDTSLSMLYLDRGKLYKGFQMYENRYAFKHMGDAYAKEWFPRWTGKEDLTQKSVLIRPEQGLGDVIQFSRYADLIKDKYKASKVDVLCKPSLHKLIKTIVGVDSCIDIKQPSELPTGYDYEIMMMSMPGLMKVSKWSDIPNKTYLSANKEDSLLWKDKLNKNDKLKVGLIWSGELKKQLGFEGMRMNRLRSIPLDMWRPVLDLDCDFYSLQFGDEQREPLKGFHAAHKITDLMGDVKDFYDTACLIDNLDLVISVDTSTAHCVGAMGKRVWMLSRKNNDWRWFSNNPKTHWYPSMTIYGQTEYDNWYPVIDKVVEDLRKLVK